MSKRHRLAGNRAYRTERETYPGADQSNRKNSSRLMLASLRDCAQLSGYGDVSDVFWRVGSLAAPFGSWRVGSKSRVRVSLSQFS